MLPEQNIRVNANMFGASVAEAQTRAGAQAVKTGKEGLALATKYAAEATEAKTNDWYAKQYTPAAIELRNQYDALEGQDKIQGYQTYIGKLEKLNNDSLAGELGDYETSLRRDMVNRRFVSEQESANRDMVVQAREFSTRAAASKMMADAEFGSAHYNNPAVVDQSWDSIEGLVTIQALDNGLDPMTEDGAFAIDEKIRETKGWFAEQLIGSAVSRGDATVANVLYAKYSPAIPAYKQEQIESVLRVENIRQNGVNGAKAIMGGERLPQPVGSPSIAVQSAIANSFYDGGMDVNEGLTLAMIESGMGTNTGVRGTIGQDKETKGQPVEVQIAAMRENWKEAKDKARDTLGRDPAPWEAYAVYQQGVGGGPALLKAATNSPMATAVDILTPLYPSRAVAASAITGNGGNLTMTSGQFLETLEKRWDRNSRVSRIGDTGATRPGDAITTAYTRTGVTVQPSATPQQAMAAFEKVKPTLLAQAQDPGISDALRAELTRQINAREGILSAAVEARKTEVGTMVSKYKYDESFTSVTQIPAEEQAIIRSEFPQEWMDLRTAADKNRGSLPGSTVAEAELGAEVDSLFDTKTNSSGDITVTMKRGTLDDAVRLQDRILTASEQGIITGESARGMIKSLQINMGKLSNADKIKTQDNDHYTKAYKEFAASGASTTEVNRMFTQYVTLSDDFKFDKVSEDRKFGPVTIKANSPVSWLLDQFSPDDKDGDPTQMTPKRAVSDILSNQAQNLYSGLVMLPSQPNAVIGRNGSTMVTSDAEPKGPADTSIPEDVAPKTFVENGMVWKISPDGTKKIRVQ